MESAAAPGASSPRDFVKNYSIVIIGDKAVGKSTLAVKAMKSDVDSSEKLRIVKDNVVKMEFITIPGENPAALEETFIKKADAFIIMYSVWDRTTLENVPAYVRRIRKIRSGKKVPTIITGNKIDMSPVRMRHVQPWEAAHLSKRIGVGYQECSALTGENMEELIQELGQLVWEEQRKLALEKDEEEFPNSKSRRKRKKCQIM